MDLLDLDVSASRKQMAVLERIHSGDRLVSDRTSAGWAWERGGRKPPESTWVKSLLNHCWVVRPVTMARCSVLAETGA